MNRLLRWSVAAAALSLAPAATLACPACMVTDPKNASTYLGMTLLMSALPLSLIGGLAWWLWRRYSRPADDASDGAPATTRTGVAKTV